MSSYKNIRLSIISVKHKKYKEIFNFKNVATKTKLQQHTKDFIKTIVKIRIFRSMSQRQYGTHKLFCKQN